MFNLHVFWTLPFNRIRYIFTAVFPSPFLVPLVLSVAHTNTNKCQFDCTIRSLIGWTGVVFRLCLLRTTPQHKCKLLLYYYYRQYSVFHLCIIYDDDIQAQPIKYCQSLATMITTTTTEFVIESHPRAHRMQRKNVKLKANVIKTSRNKTIRCVRAVSHRMRTEK